MDSSAQHSGATTRNSFNSREHNMTDENKPRSNGMNADQQMVSTLNKSEIEQQIATAHKFPRDIDRFMSRSKSLVGKTSESAGQCIYALPRDGKVIEGPSARFAEIIANAWGNCRAGARVVDDTGTFIVAQGVFHDLESNTAITFEVQRRITDRNQRRYKDDMIGVTGNAACSIALRNAILKGVPKALWQTIYDYARSVAIGDVRTLSSRRDQALKLAVKMGADNAHVFATLGVSGPEGIDNEKLFELCSILQAVKDGDSNVDDAFGLNERAPAADLNGRLKDVPEAENAATTAQEASGSTHAEPAAQTQTATGSQAAATDVKPNKAKRTRRGKPEPGPIASQTEPVPHAAAGDDGELFSAE
jgi:hypothetical protein